jgi:hypothetical protein
MDFLNWLHDFDLLGGTDWLLVGDFNLIRRPSDRNKLGGNVQYMFRFNEAISYLGLQELPLQRNKFTWSNKQVSPLLERLGWFFASISWITSYPGLVVSTLSRDVFDYHSCLVSMSTDIPKAMIFRFENFWLLHEEFFPLMQHGWNLAVLPQDKAKMLMAKFKNLQRVLKCWYANTSNLVRNIKNNKLLLGFLDKMEELRDLTLEEWNFKQIVQENLALLLEQQRVYWRQRGTIKWATLGDENTKFFHANAIVKHTRNYIRSLKNSSGVEHFQHEEKALILWEAFKERPGQS